MSTANDRQIRRRLHMTSCTFCRGDKKKCNPELRTWPQKCSRCLEKGLPCSEPVRKNRKRKANGRGADDRVVDDHTASEGRGSLPTTEQANPAARPHSGNLDWDFADLYNALGLLQLIAAECLEQRAARHASMSKLPGHWNEPNIFLPYRSRELSDLYKALQSALLEEVTSRLEIERDPATKLLFESAIGTITEPFSNLRLQLRHSKKLGDILKEQAQRLVDEGQLCLGILSLGKSVTQTQKQPDINVVKAIKSYDVPGFMENIARKFGLKGANSDAWRWPSMILPTAQPISEEEAMETVLIKNWIGFEHSLRLFGQFSLWGASPSSWKEVFRSICRDPKEWAKTDKYGRTSLHIAVLLGMNEEVKLLVRHSNLCLSQQDNAQQTALHLAAILSREDICGTLMSTTQARASIQLRDGKGRLAVWYAADAKKEPLFQRLLDATKFHLDMSAIYSDRDGDGNTLFQYAKVRGLELPDPAEGPESTDISGFYPDLYAAFISEDPSHFQATRDMLSLWSVQLE